MFKKKKIGFIGFHHTAAIAVLPQDASRHAIQESAAFASCRFAINKFSRQILLDLIINFFFKNQ